MTVNHSNFTTKLQNISKENKTFKERYIKYLNSSSKTTRTKTVEDKFKFLTDQYKQKGYKCPSIKENNLFKHNPELLEKKEIALVGSSSAFSRQIDNSNIYMDKVKRILNHSDTTTPEAKKLKKAYLKRKILKMKAKIEKEEETMLSLQEAIEMTNSMETLENDAFTSICVSNQTSLTNTGIKPKKKESRKKTIRRKILNFKTFVKGQIDKNNNRKFVRSNTNKKLRVKMNKETLGTQLLKRDLDNKISKSSFISKFIKTYGIKLCLDSMSRVKQRKLKALCSKAKRIEIDDIEGEINEYFDKNNKQLAARLAKADTRYCFKQ